MSRPFRLYSMSLARRYKIPVKYLYTLLNSNDIVEEMAYDMTQNDEYKKKWAREKELAASRKLTKDQRLAAFKHLLQTSTRKR